MWKIEVQSVSVVSKKRIPNGMVIRLGIDKKEIDEWFPKP